MTPPSRPTQSALVVGAGLSGPLMATLLAQRGYRVQMLERRGDPRRDHVEGGRSINLAVSTRGLTALQAVGLREVVESTSILLGGRLIHDRVGRTTYQPYGRRGQGIRSITRTALNQILLDAAEAAGVETLFHTAVADVELEGPRVLDQSGHVHAADFVVGADGAYSAVRSRMQRLDQVDYSQTYLSHGYKELRLPPGPDGGYRLRPDVMHIWPRGGFMLMAMANQDRSFTVTLYLPLRGPWSFATLGAGPEVRAFFGREFPDVASELADLESQFLSHHTGSLVTIRTTPWFVEDRIVLIGDACHAVVPFYGQGANAGFEDCLVLDRCLREHPYDRLEGFRTYQAGRKEHTDALADLAIGNFKEMRDAVSAPLFHWKKWIERALHRFFPNAFLPLYTMISFTTIPYGEARRRAASQWWTVRMILYGVTIVVLGLLLFRSL